MIGSNSSSTISKSATPAVMYRGISPSRGDDSISWNITPHQTRTSEKGSVGDDPLVGMVPYPPGRVYSICVRPSGFGENTISCLYREQCYDHLKHGADDRSLHWNDILPCMAFVVLPTSQVGPGGSAIIRTQHCKVGAVPQLVSLGHTTHIETCLACAETK